MPQRATTPRPVPPVSAGGRVYAIPFAAVWDALVREAAARPRWVVVAAEPRAGELRLEVRPRFGRRRAELRARLWLDADGNTRVDVESTSPARWADLGAPARRIRSFLRRLDQRLLAAAAASAR